VSGTPRTCSPTTLQNLTVWIPIARTSHFSRALPAFP
jgi:hypothetical protein